MAKTLPSKQVRETFEAAVTGVASALLNMWAHQLPTTDPPNFQSLALNVSPARLGLAIASTSKAAEDGVVDPCHLASFYLGVVYGQEGEWPTTL